MNAKLPKDDWMKLARAGLRRCAERYESFTADDLWAEIMGAEPPDPRALGSVFMWGKAQGLVEPLEVWFKSRRAVNHHRPLRAWKSLIYGGQE